MTTTPTPAENATQNVVVADCRTPRLAGCFTSPVRVSVVRFLFTCGSRDRPSVRACPVYVAVRRSFIRFGVPSTRERVLMR